MKVIKPSNLPSRFPTLHIVLAALALDYWNAPGWVWGVVMTILGLFFIVALVNNFRQEETDIFEAIESNTYVKKSKFMQKLQEAVQESAKKL